MPVNGDERVKKGKENGGLRFNCAPFQRGIVRWRSRGARDLKTGRAHNVVLGWLSFDFYDLNSSALVKMWNAH